ncbi:MAG: SGNH/GDSL hydrolase family protein [Desulfovibrionaceae bacterium]
MIYLFGNCQMEFLGRALAGAGLASEFRPLATPLGPLSASGRVPPELLEWAARFPLEAYLHGRTLKNQFQAITPDDPAPELFVVNLFHENEPLFAHEDGWLFFVDPAAWTAEPAFEAWMKARFRQVKLPAMDYLNRWAQFLAALRAAYPHTPMLLGTQLSHYPAFGPEPYSYLACWASAWREAGPFLHALAGELGGCHLLEADRAFAGAWNGSNAEGGKDMDLHCPFLRVEVAGEPGRARLVSMKRDLEHVGPLWPALAAKVKEFLETGRLCWSAAEEPPSEWAEPYAPRPLDAGRMRALLSTGGNYDAAGAVNRFFHEPDTDFGPLLAECAGFMPVCHHTLHMVHRWAMLRPSPALARWCEAQEGKAEGFTANGEEFRRRYIARVREIRELALGRAPGGAAPMAR